MSFSELVRTHCTPEMRIYAHKLAQPLSETQKDKLIAFVRENVGKPYLVLLAAYSALDKLPFFRNLKLKKKAVPIIQLALLGLLLTALYLTFKIQIGIFFA